MKKIRIIIICISMVLPIILLGKTVNYEIITGSKLGTYYKIGKDLAKYVAPEANIKLKVLHSKGSVDNLIKLTSPNYKKLKFAIVQGDVLQELVRLSKSGKGEKSKNAKKLIKDIRVIKPLYSEEIHILVRRDFFNKKFF